MKSSRTLGLVMIAPAAIMIVLFFLMPVVLTAVFSMTNMTTATGISGGAYQIAPSSLNTLKSVMPDIAYEMAEPRYAIDEAGLKAVEGLGLAPGIAAELRAKHAGEVFPTRREAERMLKDLAERPSTREVKQISEQFNRSIVNTRFDSKGQLFSALDTLGLKLTPEQKETVARASYTGWTWTTDNFSRIATSPDMARVLFNTALYVALVLTLFNVGYALLLAIWTHYMPPRPASIFRGIWLLPRITPVVIYILLWKWLAWDSGFISVLMGKFGYPAKNYLLDTAYNAWFFVVLINGFIGASMGMLVFSSAMKAIPKSQFYASEVDGASRWQQIRYIILPQMRWPILFVTCYQTLSLLASFNEILLATNGGPGNTTEVWALAAYHTALRNYAGNLEYGLGAAMALVLVVIGVTLSLLYLRVFNYRTLVAKPLIED
ncbi:carbohydrate ABC transporter permease [Rhizobium bangladeshense]|uniref:carbohydrate ABC transporter permease n=1 Tax=Rhizobium bangladeshense TaxID=1138189 RepID=UPI001A9823BD|nr:sugar ABC transporter permease [Rhizobium bangladeshense]MBX4870419.1 sugar ABC transporter permease [Rhizobium bangladeshense]MBX4893046.1 sugar ABC transporter permease [Rhizobium bangladeshense]MBX4935757.1 sugar ABC transporter permease [Rhizobium bangladeshense]MBY3584901.1 sugar ABC transporter permease [Rhizobium bangladeshense]MBY3599456.1 sugar ABC transporter permease [Rhizobium bangladeshense]